MNKMENKLLAKAILKKEPELYIEGQTGPITWVLNDQLFGTIIDEKFKKHLKVKINTNGFVDYLNQNNLIIDDSIGTINKPKEITPSNFGTIIEGVIGVYFDLDDFNDDYSFIFDKLHNYLDGSVAYSFAIKNNGPKFMLDIKNFLNNKTLLKQCFDKAKWLKTNIGNLIDSKELFNSFSPIIMHEYQSLIDCFELDMITDKNIIVDLKTSQSLFKKEWLYQLLLYYLILKRYDFCKFDKIAIYNPLLGKLYILDPHNIIDIDEIYSWAIRLKVI